LFPDQDISNVILVETTLLKEFKINAATNPPTVWVQTGMTIEDLLEELEKEGFGLLHVPAPGKITVGGALAVNAHGSGINVSPTDIDGPYGTLSNLIHSFTAVVSENSHPYRMKTFHRADPDAKALLTHCGRAFLLSVTLQVVKNYNLRCQSYTNIEASTLFALPDEDGVPFIDSVGDFLNKSGRIEVIWFPAFSTHGYPHRSYPWLKVWTVTPEQPPGSRKVKNPYNYAFAENLPKSLTKILNHIISDAPWFTPKFCFAYAQITDFGLNGEFGSPDLSDLWGPSKNTLLYVKSSTIRAHVNGYAILMKREQIQRAIYFITKRFSGLLEAYHERGLWPINMPLEIRVTGLDDPSKIFLPDGKIAESPLISSVSVDETVIQRKWDCALWIDVFTILPHHPEHHRSSLGVKHQFYIDFENWIFKQFPAPEFRINPEWSKGWAYGKAKGAWTNDDMMRNFKANFNWQQEVNILAKYDSANIFTNPLLEQLFK